MTILEVLLTITNIVTLFLLVRVAKKSEKLTQIIEDYNVFYDALRTNVENMQFILKRIDVSGAFEVDDETGIIYSTIKQMVSQLGEFFNNQESIDAEKEG